MNGLLRVLTGLGVLIGVGLIVVMLWVIAQPERFQPLTYQTGRVVVIEPDGTPRVPQVGGYDAPSIVASSDGVPVNMELCSDHDETIHTTAKTWFVSSDTHTRTQFSEEGTEFPVEPGCVTIRFKLEIPREVVNEVDNQTSARSTDSVAFTIEGEVDIDNGGTAMWRTESFLIVDDDPVIRGD